MGCENLTIEKDYPDGGTDTTTEEVHKPDQLFSSAIDQYGDAIRRLVRGYEADPDKQRDLLQEIHLNLWMSFKSFNGRCSLRTWTYRIAHNVGAAHIAKSRRFSSALVHLENLESEIVSTGPQQEARLRLAI